MRYLRMVTNALLGGVLAAMYLTVLMLQLNPHVAVVSVTALRWFGAFLALYGPYLTVTILLLILAREAVTRLEAIDRLIAETAERWRPERMAVIDRLILRMAIGELLGGPDTPHAVVINEALELARTFSTEDAVKFVNGMLDAVRKKLER